MIKHNKIEDQELMFLKQCDWENIIIYFDSPRERNSNE